MAYLGNKEFGTGLVFGAFLVLVVDNKGKVRGYKSSNLGNSIIAACARNKKRGTNRLYFPSSLIRYRCS